MVRRLGSILARLFRSITPDPFVLAIGLSVVALFLAFAFGDLKPAEVVSVWSTGLWSLLSFGMQMALVLVTGHALASAPVVRRLIDRLVGLPSTARSAGAMVSVVAILASLLNWGLGLIVGALMAREMGRRCYERGIRAHYPLLAAAGYSGLMAWHGGLSGSAPLKVTTQADLVELLGASVAARVVPVSTYETIFSVMNLVVCLGLLILVPLMVSALSPTDAECEDISSFEVPKDAVMAVAGGGSTLADRLDSSRAVNLLLVLPLGAGVVLYLFDNGLGRLDPNAINLILLTAGLAFHPSPLSYVRAVSDAVRGAAGIILQFPLYGGIMALMSKSGLASTAASFAAQVGSGTLYGVLTFLAAGLINLFVPSGGGQWAVQGPVAVDAAARLGLELSHAVMAVAYGDQWTNMLQPFWALPLLGITGVRAKDIIGYTAMIMIAGGIWFISALVVFA